MLDRALLFTTVVVACSSLTACQKSATVGAFALDIPNGWNSASEEPNVLALGTESVEWTFVVMTFTAAEIEGDKSLSAVGHEIAKAVAEKDEADASTMRFDQPNTWAQAGLEGILMDGEIINPELTMQIKLLVVVADDQYLVALGFRGPHAQPKHDKAMQGLLASIRKAG